MISQEEYDKYYKSYSYAEYCKYACDKLCTRRNYLMGIYEDYPKVEFVYDEGLERFFSSSFDIIAIAVLLLFGSNVFSYEYESGFYRIMRVSQKGRLAILKTKILYSALMGIFVYLVFAIINMFFLMYYYSIDFWHIPIQSMPIFSNISVEMSIAQYMIIYQCLSFLGFILMFIFTSSVSAISGSQLKSIIISAFVILITYYIGDSARFLPNYAGMLTPQNISKNAISYVICVTLTLLIAIMIYLKWCGRNYKNEIKDK